MGKDMVLSISVCFIWDHLPDFMPLVETQKQKQHCLPRPRSVEPETLNVQLITSPISALLLTILLCFSQFCFYFCCQPISRAQSFIMSSRHKILPCEVYVQRHGSWLNLFPQSFFFSSASLSCNQKYFLFHIFLVSFCSLSLSPNFKLCI